MSRSHRTLVLTAIVAAFLIGWRGPWHGRTDGPLVSIAEYEGSPSERFDVRELSYWELRSVRIRLIGRLYADATAMADPSLAYSLVSVQRKLDLRQTRRDPPAGRPAGQSPDSSR